MLRICTLLISSCSKFVEHFIHEITWRFTILKLRQPEMKGFIESVKDTKETNGIFGKGAEKGNKLNTEV